jgi:glycine cleavage system H lipoate-binding protein
MRCPFLREAQVKSCQASSFRKVIPRASDSGMNELCSSPAHVRCAVVRSYHEGSPSPERCPFLHESLVQYCASAPVPKYVPYSESSISRCGNDTHLYCELYLSLAAPAGGSPLETVPAAGGHATVDGIDVPAGLRYAQNHLWLDVSPDGTCHVGVDAFLARVLGECDEVTFLTTRGTVRPSARLSVRGVDLPLLFPKAIRITSANSMLRVHPDRLVSDPYGNGWLFEGTLPEEGPKKPQSGAEPAPSLPLLPGPEAAGWIHEEVSRLNHVVHDLASRPDPDGLRFMADGGTFAGGLPKHLTREETMRLFDSFFSSEAGLLRPAREVHP